MKETPRQREMRSAATRPRCYKSKMELKLFLFVCQNIPFVQESRWHHVCKALLTPSLVASVTKAQTTIRQARDRFEESKQSGQKLESRWWCETKYKSKRYRALSTQRSAASRPRCLGTWNVKNENAKMGKKIIAALAREGRWHRHYQGPGWGSSATVEVPPSQNAVCGVSGGSDCSLMFSDLNGGALYEAIQDLV